MASKFPENLPPGWRERLSAEAQAPYFRELTQFLRQEAATGVPIFPRSENVLRALKAVDYEAVRVVILGQDPYHGPNQAIGLSFAVPNQLVRKPPSLVNIFKELEKDLGKKIDFTQSELSSWAAQGVLLLNTVLTVRQGQANSHAKRGWETFTDKVLMALNQRSTPIVFVLWGAHARKKKELVTNSWHHVIESAHPSPLSAHNGFFGSRPFSKVNRILAQQKQPPIGWEITS